MEGNKMEQEAWERRRGMPLKAKSLVDRLKEEIEFLQHHESWGVYFYSVTSGRMTTLLQDALDQIRRQ